MCRCSPLSIAAFCTLDCEMGAKVTIVGSVLGLLALLVIACSPGGNVVQESVMGGCGRTRASGSSVGSIIQDNLRREYRVHIPASYDGVTPVPLVLNLHGYGSNAADQEAYSEMVTKANVAGFITVAPEGTGEPQRWHIYGPQEEGYIDDVAFFETLLDHLQATLCIDRDRVYVTGISNGAAMSVRLACHLGDRIAAVAAVAGVYAPMDCPTERAVPLIAFHGTGDELVPFDTGRAGRYSVPTRGVRVAMADWAARNGCQPQSVPERIEPDVLVERYQDCRDGAEVVLYVIEDGGHTWPGSRLNVERFGKTTRTISATELMWEFFAAHPLSR